MRQVIASVKNVRLPGHVAGAGRPRAVAFDLPALQLSPDGGGRPRHRALLGHGGPCDRDAVRTGVAGGGGGARRARPGGAAAADRLAVRHPLPAQGTDGPDAEAQPARARADSRCPSSSCMQWGTVGAAAGYTRLGAAAPRPPSLFFVLAARRASRSASSSARCRGPFLPPSPPPPSCSGCARALPSLEEGARSGARACPLPRGSEGPVYALTVWTPRLFREVARNALGRHRGAALVSGPTRLSRACRTGATVSTPSDDAPFAHQLYGR